MKRQVAVWLLMIPAASAQTEAPFYWYGNEKILLKPAEKVVAAKVQESVAYRQKFPWLEKTFRQVGSSGLRPEAVLFSMASASERTARDALASGINSKEIYNLPVFELGNARAIVQNEVIVRFKESQTDAATAEAFLQRFTQSYAKQPEPGLRYLVRVPDPTRTLAWADLLHRNHTVEYAEPSFVVVQTASTLVKPAFVLKLRNQAAPASAVFPSDALFTQQWALPLIMATKAWVTTHGSKNIKIAVIDEGVDALHPDLKDKVAASWDAIFETDQVDPPLQDAHGTEVAGVAAAVTNNALGIAGVAADVSIVSVRMMSQVDSGSDSKSTVVAANAIDKAIALGADILNCSWTMSLRSKDVESAIQAAASRGRNGKGAVVVFAAGNEGAGVSYPANLTREFPIIAVGASNERDELKTANSTDGENWWASNAGVELSVVAPGVHIVTTVNRNATAANQEPYITNFNGTSSAAPHVAGLAALILSQHPDWTAQQVRDQIVQTADTIGTLPANPAVPLLRINACRALGRTDCGGSARTRP